MPNLTSSIDRKTVYHDSWKLPEIQNQYPEVSPNIKDPKYTPSDLTTSIWYGAIQIWAKNNNQIELYQKALLNLNLRSNLFVF